MKLSIIKTFTFLLAGGLLFTACGDDFLDRQPIDQIDSQNFFRTESDMNSATLAIYTAMQSQQFFGESWRIEETPSDDSRQNFGAAIDNFTATANDGEVINYWSGHYRVVTLSNVVIEKTPGADISPGKQDTIIAEARFLRALAYYNLVRVYGGVPIITAIPTLEDDLLYPRSSVDEVYDFIKADLEFAADHLPLTTPKGRATSGAANAYLASVHLTLREYEQARDRSRRVIDSGVYALMPSYGDLWIYDAGNENNAESIFEIQYTGCEAWGTGNPRQAFFAPWNQGITKGTDGWGSLLPTDPTIDQPNTTAVDIWEEGDERRYWSMMEPGNYYPDINAATDGGYTYPMDGAGGAARNIRKYVMGGGNDVCFMSTPQNGSLMRYSEVLLIYAEALAELSNGITLNQEALELVNGLRTRAGVEPLEFLDSETIELERRREFMFEGKRWFDILRKGTEEAVLLMRLHGRTLDETRLLFPLPASELEINPNLTQNPGY